jgi:AraC-like DNA-binding protein
MTVKELAFCVGVDDQYYFSRMFTRLMGISPSIYRKRNSDNKQIPGANPS